MAREIRRHIDISVRFHETDMLGVVHNAVYFQWFELGRMDILQQILPVEKAMKDGIATYVTYNECHYENPSKFGDHVVLTTRAPWSGPFNGRLEFLHELTNKSTRRTLAKGRSILALCKIPENTLIRDIPDEILQRIQELLGG